MEMLNGFVIEDLKVLGWVPINKEFYERLMVHLLKTFNIYNHERYYRITQNKIIGF